jgi:phage repressor protein C with HTH and peptisase S24 domain
VDDPDLVGSLVPFQASSTSVEQFGMRMIPEINLDFALGGGAFIDGPIETTMVPFRKDWLDRISRYGPADVFLTRGDGDSMMPTILDEDDILVNRADRVITRQDRIWAIAYGDLATIKRVRRTATGSFLLMSDNTAVSPIEAAEDEIHVVGRVIWIGRKM